MFFTTLRRVALAITVASLPLSNALAHCFVGERFFPATLVTDDPCVADKMSLPTVDYFPTAGIGAPAGREVDIEADISKRITADFDVDIQYTWTQIRTPNSPTQAGFSDLETTFQYQLLKYAPTELALMLGLIVDWGGTGATNAGIGTSHHGVAHLLHRPGLWPATGPIVVGAALRPDGGVQLQHPEQLLRLCSGRIHSPDRDL
jgi:hypothetical protein